MSAKVLGIHVVVKNSIYGFSFTINPSHGMKTFWYMPNKFTFVLRLQRDVSPETRLQIVVILYKVTECVSSKIM
jgi:hypothetical protein